MKPRVVLFACIGLMIFHQITALLWMQFTLMQVVIAVSWPIPFPHPDRKIFFNIGFQFNYAEPFRPSSFYQPTYWPLGRSATEGDSADNGTTAESQSGGEKSARSLSVEDQHPELRGRDLTAGELYKSIEGNLEVFGFDKSCLLKSICELARHPLHEDDEEHLLVEVLNFMMTPTQHKGFAPAENYERAKYEMAQHIGESGGDCGTVYAECENSILNRMTNLSNDFYGADETKGAVQAEQ